MTFIVKGILHFDDGVNKGQIQVKASSPEEAKRSAIEQLCRTWGIQPKDIEIIEVRKR